MIFEHIAYCSISPKGKGGHSTHGNLFVKNFNLPNNSSQSLYCAHVSSNLTEYPCFYVKIVLLFKIILNSGISSKTVLESKNPNFLEQ